MQLFVAAQGVLGELEDTWPCTFQIQAHLISYFASINKGGVKLGQLGASLGAISCDCSERGGLAGSPSLTLRRLEEGVGSLWSRSHTHFWHQSKPAFDPFLSVDTGPLFGAAKLWSGGSCI